LTTFRTHASDPGPPPPPSQQEKVYGRKWELVADHVPASQTTLTIEFLQPGFGYRIRVFAKNEHGWGSPSFPSPMYKLPIVPHLSVATRTSLVVKWSQPFLEPVSRRTELSEICGDGEDSEDDYGLQHALWMPAEAQYVYKLQYQVCLADEVDGCMIWRPFHRCGRMLITALRAV
jgi:hypothetical protein